MPKSGLSCNLTLIVIEGPQKPVAVAGGATCGQNWNKRSCSWCDVIAVADDVIIIC